MKIVCDKCQTKYSIADEKVSGKVFKIRCKKCSHIIVVKGSESATGRAAPGDAVAVTGAAAADDKVWFLVVAGEQVGPFSGAEVRGRFGAGEVDGETYAWREGFGDWLRLASIEDFRDLQPTSNPAAATNGNDTRRTDVGDMFAQHQQREREEGGAGAAEIFGRTTAAAAARPMSVSARPVAAAAASDDLFSGAAAATGATTTLDAPEPARSRGAAASFGGAAQAAPGDAKLTGQRNENSMLFSLSNLSAMATAGGAAAPKPAETRAGFATVKNEGSGLIDIRAMAAATLSSASSGGSGDSAGDLPSFSAAPVFTPVVAAPVMMPTQSSRMPGWAWALVAVGLVGIIGVFGLVAALVVRKPEPLPPAPIVVQQPAPAPPVAAAPVAAAPVAAAPAAAAPAPAPAADAAHKAAAAAGPRHVAVPAVRGGKAAVATAPEPPPRAAPAPSGGRRRASGNDSLDDLLNAVPEQRATSRAPAAAPAAVVEDDPNLPQTLDKPDVVAGMKGVEPRVNGCFAQFHVPGTAMVSMTIAKTGRVSNANVLGALAGTPTGDCVAKAVRSATFKRFRNPSLSVQYPFVLR